MARLVVAYFLWLVGGLWGLHHIYLNRPNQLFLYNATVGGFGFGFIRDLWRIPAYVKQANRDPLYLDELKRNMKQRPIFSIYRAVSMYVFAYMLGTIAQGPLGFFEPDEAVSGVTSLFELPIWWSVALAFATSIGILIAVQIIGSIDGERTVTLTYIYLAIIVGTFLDTLSAVQADVAHLSVLRCVFPVIVYERTCEWIPTCADVKPSGSRKCSWMGRMCRVLAGLFVFYSVALMYLYNFATVDVSAFTPSPERASTSDEELSNDDLNYLFNLGNAKTYTHSYGNKGMRVKTVIRNFLQSAFWANSKVWLWSLYESFSSDSDFEWTRAWTDMDLGGVTHAKTVMELEGVDSFTLKDLNRIKRRLQKQYHPDTVSAALKDEATAKFIQVQEAYATLKMYVQDADHEAASSSRSQPHTHETTTQKDEL